MGGSTRHHLEAPCSEYAASTRVTSHGRYDGRQWLGLPAPHSARPPAPPRCCCDERQWLGLPAPHSAGLQLRVASRGCCVGSSQPTSRGCCARSELYEGSSQAVLVVGPSQALDPSQTVLVGGSAGPTGPPAAVAAAPSAAASAAAAAAAAAEAPCPFGPGRLRPCRQLRPAHAPWCDRPLHDPPSGETCPRTSRTRT